MLAPIILTALKILFMYEAMQEGMIFHRLRLFLEWFTGLFPEKVGEWISKPLYACVFCMASVWGAIFLLLDNFLPQSVYITIFFAIGGVTYLFSLIIGFLHDVQNKMAFGDPAAQLLSTLEPLPPPIPGQWYSVFRNGDYLGAAEWKDTLEKGCAFVLDDRMGQRFIIDNVDYWTTFDCAMQTKTPEPVPEVEVDKTFYEDAIRYMGDYGKLNDIYPVVLVDERFVVINDHKGERIEVPLGYWILKTIDNEIVRFHPTAFHHNARPVKINFNDGK